MSRHHFRNLDAVVDEVHALFDAWAESGALAPVLSVEGTYVFRLAVHEWIANLVQHAAFPTDPEIVLDVEVRGGQVWCAIEDTSRGFDFAGQIERQQALLDAPAPSERGRGLLMLITCTTDLDYQPAEGCERQRIAFAVRTPADSIFAPLFRPEDIAAAAAQSPFALQSGPDDAHDAPLSR